MDSKKLSSLPLRRSLKPVFVFSFIAAALAGFVSVMSILFSSSVYPDEALLRSFIPNDIINLVIGLPVLLGSMWAAWRGRLTGLLCWPGALFFMVYNYIAYVFALPLSWLFLFHISIVAAGIYTLAGLAACIDAEAVKLSLEGAVHERLSGGVLIALGLLFLVRVIVVVVSSLRGEALPAAEFAVNISDFLISPAWIIAGILLLRRRAFGYAAGLGLLFQGSMLFIALICFLFLQPVLTSAPFSLTDVIVIFVMGLVCFVPFALFMRGAARKRP